VLHSKQLNPKIKKVMIVSEIFYGIKCNRCEEQFEGFEYSFFSDKQSVIEAAMESEWIEDNGKHYCSNCYEQVEETDENTIKPQFPEHIKKTKMFIDKILKSYSASISEKEGFFQITTGLYSGTKLESFEENYIKDLLGEKLISLEYQKHERYTRYDCVINIKK
jgi:hypothetical protein